MVKFVLLLLLPSLLFAATGSIAGRVCDISCNPLAGATVMIVGTSLGALTDPNGEYLIEGVEPGSYSLQARMVGMGEKTIQGIVVFANQVTIFDFGGHGTGGPIMPDEEVTCGRIMVAGDSLIVTDLPLQHTSADIKVTGNFQMCVFSQVFTNPYDVPIEATYVFPLPVDGAVSSMRVYIGEEVIEGHVYQDEVASEIYEEALDEGRTAALLVQERPNVFTQQLGNILPSDSITVEITYVAPVQMYENEYEIVFPMVVPPKYIPGLPSGDGERGWSSPTTQVPDADRINPSVVPEDTRTAYDIDLTVSIDAGIPVKEILSVNHDISTDEDDGIITVELTGEDKIPNRDFRLRYSVLSDDWEAGLIATSGTLGGHFMLVLQPEEDLTVDNPEPREYFFVVDCSGSMSGQPMAVAKETMRVLMRNMTSEDTYQIIRFSNTASSFSEAPIPANRRNVNLGLAYVELMSGTGGTEMLNGVRAALGYPENPELSRYVIFLTDGQIGNETAVIEEVRSILGGQTLLWSVGIGSSPNRFLLDGIAQEGKGRSFYVGLQEDPATAAERIVSQVTGNYINSLTIDWGDLAVTEIYPQEIPNLYPGEPLFITGRYQGGGRERIEIRGSIGNDSWRERLSVNLPYQSNENQGIAIIWAREKIHQMERYLPGADDEDERDSLINEITSTALDYQILSNYTSFVAVTEEIRTDEQGNSISVEVPVNMPEGQSYEGTFGGSLNGLEPEAVGSTVISVCDQRGVILRDVTSSVTVVSRDNLRTMPVGSSETSRTFVGMERDMALTSPSGITVSVLSLAVSAEVEETSRRNLCDAVLSEAARVADNQGRDFEGMVIVRLTFGHNAEATTAELVRNFTESESFGEELIESLSELQIYEEGWNGIRYEISIEFAR